MEFGVSVGHISAVDFAQHGERLGFTRCWVTDSPLLRSNLFATMAAVLMAVALAGCYVPARRATRVNPIAALKTD